MDSKFWPVKSGTLLNLVENVQLELQITCLIWHKPELLCDPDGLINEVLTFYWFNWQVCFFCWGLESGDSGYLYTTWCLPHIKMLFTDFPRECQYHGLSCRLKGKCHGRWIDGSNALYFGLEWVIWLPIISHSVWHLPLIWWITNGAGARNFFFFGEGVGLD